MSFITRCPHCETSFNITESQLQKAHGIVRCGFCLLTFSALEHQLYLDEEIDLGIIDITEEEADADETFDDTELPAGEYESMPPADTQDSGETQNLQIPTLEAANDILDEDQEAASLHNEASSQEESRDSDDKIGADIESDIEDDEAIHSPESRAQKEKSWDSESTEDNNVSGAVDEDAETLLQDEFPTNQAVHEDDELSDDRNDIEAEADEALYPADSQANEEATWVSESSDDIEIIEDEELESSLVDAIQENAAVSRNEEVTEVMNPVRVDAAGIEQPADTDSSLEDSYDETENEFELGLPESDSEEEYSLESAELLTDSTAPATAHSASAENGSASPPITRSSAAKPELQILSSLYDDSPLERLDESNLNSLSDEPIAMHQQAAGSRLLKSLLLSLNVILLLGLLAQAVWKNIDSLLLDARFAPFSNLLCQVLACPAVAQFDLNQFSTEELFVNAHPQRENALQIDFIFRNNASYPQAFPLVELNFTDLNRRLLANRLFSPDEYLDPELQQFDLLPAGASIQIQLEISDPGPEAINYSLALRHPGTP